MRLLPTTVLVFSMLTSRLSQQSCPMSCIQQKLFRRLSLDDLVVVAQDTLATETVTSDLDCGVQCGRTEGCIAFTFLPSQNDPQGECRMYEQLVNSTMDGDPSPGARSYSVRVQNCDNGYSLMCDRCLRFVNTSANFTQALAICQGLDQGHMAVIKTLEDVECVRSILRTHGSTPLMYLGADDLAERGKFMWHDCTALPVGSALWTDGQPEMRDDGERCVGINLAFSRVHDFYCSLRATVLCQRDLVG